MNEARHEKLITIMVEAIRIHDILPSKFSGVKVGLLDQQKDRIAVSCEECDITGHFSALG